ncbi:MAG: chemotaxis protein CheX [Atribacterota bacterium]
MITELGSALQEVLSAFGLELGEFKIIKEDMHLVTGVLCVITGLLECNGERKGIMSLEFDEKAASFLLGIMIGDVSGLSSEMGLSALSELATMICGSFLTRLNVMMVATPPTGVMGGAVRGILNTMPAEKVSLFIGGGLLLAGLSVS